MKSVTEASCDADVTLQDIIIFATGATHVPPLGFPQQPQILFIHDNDSIFPRANTCSLELSIPTVHKNYDDFKRNMNFGIANANDFAFA